MEYKTLNRKAVYLNKEQLEHYLEKLASDHILENNSSKDTYPIPKMKENFESLVNELGKQDNVKILEYTNKVPELMSISDLVVTKPGGLTTTESLASGLPIVVINPIPGQEEENATYLEENKVAIWIRKDDNVEEILNNLFKNPDKMQEMKIRARLISKKNSTKDICKILLR